MHDVNWWLMALAFLAGLVLTFVTMIGRVTREVPVSRTVSAAAGAGAAGAVSSSGVAHTLAGSPADTGGRAGAAAGIASIDEVPAGPHGRGSAKPNADGSGPAGWLIKGNADSMLYHGPDSPAYQQTVAEVWFFDEATARAAGFDKWDKNFR